MMTAGILDDESNVIPGKWNEKRDLTTTISGANDEKKSKSDQDQSKMDQGSFNIR